MPELAVAGAEERLVNVVSSFFACALSIAPAFANDLPRFQVDASWPKTLPNNLDHGTAADVAVDAQDRVWVIQRPRTLSDDEKAATFNPPLTGTYKRHWGAVHNLAVDSMDNIYTTEVDTGTRTQKFRYVGPPPK